METHLDHVDILLFTMKKEAREKKLSNIQLGDKTGLTPKTISNIFLGKNASMDSLRALSKAIKEA
jgi:transcriptional regulator with XRE-family HTH domain